MRRVLTIGGEYGSGRAEIARAAAAKLSWRLVDNCLIEDIAYAAHLDPSECRRYDERTDPWFHRLRKALWQGGFEGVASTSEQQPADAETVAQVAHRVIQQAAREGNCVIVGRGAQCLLQDRPDVFHVFVYAPRPERIERVQRREGTRADAESLVDTWDRRRAAYIRRYFGEDWTDHRLYDLMLSSSIGDAAAVATILAAFGPES